MHIPAPHFAFFLSCSPLRPARHRKGPTCCSPTLASRDQAPFSGRRSPTLASRDQAPFAGRRSPTLASRDQAPFTGRRSPTLASRDQAPFTGRRSPTLASRDQAPFTGRRSPTLASRDQAPFSGQKSVSPTLRRPPSAAASARAFTATPPNPCTGESCHGASPLRAHEAAEHPAPSHWQLVPIEHPVAWLEDGDSSHGPPPLRTYEISYRDNVRVVNADAVPVRYPIREIHPSDNFIAGSKHTAVASLEPYVSSPRRMRQNPLTHFAAPCYGRVQLDPDFAEELEFDGSAERTHESGETSRVPISDSRPRIPHRIPSMPAFLSCSGVNYSHTAMNPLNALTQCPINSAHILPIECSTHAVH